MVTNQCGPLGFNTVGALPEVCVLSRAPLAWWWDGLVSI